MDAPGDESMPSDPRAMDVSTGELIDVVLHDHDDDDDENDIGSGNHDKIQCIGLMAPSHCYDTRLFRTTTTSLKDDTTTSVELRRQENLSSDPATSQNLPPSSALANVAAGVITKPLDTLVDTIEEQVNGCLDSSLSCCQWLQDLAVSANHCNQSSSPITTTTTKTAVICPDNDEEARQRTPDCQPPGESIQEPQEHENQSKVVDVDDNLPYLLQIQSTESSETTTRVVGTMTSTTKKSSIDAHQQDVIIRNTTSLLSDSSEEEDDEEEMASKFDGEAVDLDCTATTDLSTICDDDVGTEQRVMNASTSKDEDELVGRTNDHGGVLVLSYSTDNEIPDVAEIKVNDHNVQAMGRGAVESMGDDKSDQLQFDPDTAMELMLREMDEYVGENNIRYHETSPERSTHAVDGRPMTKLTPESVIFEAPPREASSAVISSVSTSSEAVNDSFESAHEGSVSLHSDSNSDEDGFQVFFMTPPRQSAKRLSFADDHGLELEHTLVLDQPRQTSGRVVILLLSPSQRVFEFIHLDCPYDDSTTVQVLVDQLPALATMHPFRYTKFVALARIKSNIAASHYSPDSRGTSSQEAGSQNSSKDATKGDDDDPMPTLLDPATLLGNVEFRNCELVLAIPDRLTCSEIVMHAYPLLMNGTIMKALQAGRRSGRGLKTVKNGEEWYKNARPNATATRESHRADEEDGEVGNHASREWRVVAELADEVGIFEVDSDEYVSSWEEMQQMVDKAEEEVDLSWIGQDHSSTFRDEEREMRLSQISRQELALIFLFLCLATLLPLACREIEIQQFNSQHFWGWLKTNAPNATAVEVGRGKRKCGVKEALLGCLPVMQKVSSQETKQPAKSSLAHKFKA